MPSHRILLGFMLCLTSLAGCAETTVTVLAPPTSTIAALSSIDWANFTYPYDCSATPATVTVQNGRADLPDRNVFIVSTPIFGDVTGDGQPEAVIPHDCIGGQPRGKQFYIYTGTAAHPHFLSNLPLSTDSQPDISIGDPAKVVFGGNRTLTLGGVGYSSDAIPVCCPDLSITDTFTWESTHFVLTNQQHVPYIPPAGTPPS